MTLLRVALTGGIATGKSYVLSRFAAKGVPTVDADAIAHDVVRAGQPAARDIRERFGDGVFSADGEIDRARLARRVFESPTDRAALEAIVHPRVRAAIDTWFSELTASGQGSFAIADIPLLFETGRQHHFDRVIVTACPQAVQIARLASRDGMSRDDAQKRIAAQLPSAEKTSGADFVIRTDGSFAETDRQVDAVYEALTEECRG